MIFPNMPPHHLDAPAENFPSSAAEGSNARGNALQASDMPQDFNSDIGVFQQRLPSSSELQRQAPGWLRSAADGSTAAAGQKHYIEPPTPPGKRRSGWESASDQVMTGWSHAGLQHQVQMEQRISDAINANLNQFQMEWSSLDEAQQSAVWNAASDVPPGEDSEIARQEQVHAALTKIQLPRHMEWLGSPLQEEPDTIDPSLLQDGGLSPRDYGAMSIDAPHENVGGSAFLFPEQTLEVAQAPATIPYSTKDSWTHWRTHSAEFEPMLAVWNAATGISGGGAALLRHLSALCDAELAAGRGAPVKETGGMVFEFAVTPHPNMDAQIIWRGADSSGAPHLRCAPALGSVARATLAKEMQVSAKKSASMRRKAPSVVAYDSATAQNHWTGPRRQEFEPLLTFWNAVTGLSGTGGALLRHLSALCDAELGAGRGTEVAGTEGMVFEFTVTPHPGMDPQTIWRGLNGLGVPNLRRAPAPDLIAARAALVKSMQTSAKITAGKRQDTTEAIVPYDRTAAKSHWRTRSSEFGQLLSDWNQATSRSDSGAALLQHLSALCDTELFAERGTPVAGTDDKIYEFTVTPHPGMDMQTIWRGLDGNKKPVLRLPPAPDALAERTALAKAIQASAKMSAGKKRKGP